MSGQCYGCGTGFSLFKKEHGCKNCGFAFCSNCLTKKIALPKDNTKHRVCNKCFDILSGKTVAEDPQRFSPPEAFKKRVAALQEREAQNEKPSVKSFKPQHSKYMGLSKADREIAERLDKLRESPNEQKVTDEELIQGLARLRGESPATASANSKPMEQVDDLLDEIASEVEIDSHRQDPVQYVENRLARLRKEESGAAQDEQNNLDRNDKTPKKSFVKNIDVKPNSSKKPDGGLSADDGKVDFEAVHAFMAAAALEMEDEAHKALEGMQSDKQLMEQLAQLKQRRKEKGENSGNIEEQQSLESNIENTEIDEDSDNEEAAVKHILQQFTEEVTLDEKVGNLLAKNLKGTHKSKYDSGSKMGRKEENTKDGNDDSCEDPDELPYCCICTEDASIRCRDCDMDLYCAQCFRDGHKELGLTDHRTIPYTPPKGYR
ncbi:abscission/NoCut checkpoint regulator-like isoform X2 [Pomacea canaliculata]|uniref:abscission/NoCut checkpoint regulator-like isoform X2 n=1 Tax=Pomacea canaliculata TaxID=400727 RepID=UPI000D72998C|nr:abscission/NoCut checkpoint regulator-like isoform X2 [Pomacea canaliculata]